jgi:acyl carrier protein phosphodiesterase
MNFLAHLFLSGSDPSIMVGNFIGDFVKGRKEFMQYPPKVIMGIELHRAIDLFTDTHLIVKNSKARLREKYRHYAPVIVDVFYDHFLAKNWSSYSDVPLEKFARDSYNTLLEFEMPLPEKVHHMLPYMVHGNWLVHYASLEGIQRSLTGMARRTPYDSKMDEAVNELRTYYGAFQEDFQQFFPELQAHCKKFLE